MIADLPAARRAADARRVAVASVPSRWSPAVRTIPFATRRASAVIVDVGFTAPEVTNKLPSAMNRFLGSGVLLLARECDSARATGPQGDGSVEPPLLE